MPINQMMNLDSSVLDSAVFTPGQQREPAKSVINNKKGGGMLSQRKSIVF